MIAPIQKISDDLRLIAPNVERDALLSIGWMQGSSGHETQEAMGIPPAEIHDHILAEDQRLIQYFIDTDEELVWMIEHDGKVIGSIEIGLKIPKEENGPSISIMIGDIAARGKGIGEKVMNAAIRYLKQSGYCKVNARYRIGNLASERMNHKLGFVKTGRVYSDEDGLEWQNLRKDLL